MSFASNVRAELCRTAISRHCCAVAECYGVLLYCSACSASGIRIVTESRDFAARLPQLFRKAFSISFDDQPETLDQPGKMIYQFTDPAKISAIFEGFGLNAGESLSLHINLGALEEEHCQVSFLRGAFLAGGSVTNPEKRYHLELSTSHIVVNAECYALLLELGFQPKDTVRGGERILYFKQSNAIEDFLTLISAPVCAMQIMEAKVEKDLRNEVNRRVNCDTANLSKAVDAAQEHLAAIRVLQESGKFETLSERIRKTAQLRMDHPEATLSELAAMHEPPLTKSAVNHRLRKLLEAARSV